MIWLFRFQTPRVLRDTDDPIEVEGIDYGLSEIKEADLVVGIFDSIDEVVDG